MQPAISIFYKTKDHLAMRMIKMGLSEVQVLKRMVLMNIGLALGALLLVFSPAPVGWIVLALIILWFLAFTIKMAKVKVD